MKTFALKLWAATGGERFARVSSFVGRDESGSFGLLAGRARFMTALSFGLARFREAGGEWWYLALPGGLLYFVDNELTIVTRRYLLDRDYGRIGTLLGEQLRQEEEGLREVKESLHRLEDEMLRRLWELQRGGERAG